MGRGGELSVARPPRPRHSEFGRRRHQAQVQNQPGRVIPGKHPTKTQNMIYYRILKTYPTKLGQAADEIFRVAAWTRSELVVSLRLWVGQVDAEKLAQRSSVAAWVLICLSECVWCHLSAPSTFSSDFDVCFGKNKSPSLKLAFARFRPD